MVRFSFFSLSQCFGVGGAPHGADELPSAPAFFFVVGSRGVRPGKAQLSIGPNPWRSGGNRPVDWMTSSRVTYARSSPFYIDQRRPKLVLGGRLLGGATVTGSELKTP